MHRYKISFGGEKHKGHSGIDGGLPSKSLAFNMFQVFIFCTAASPSPPTDDFPSIFVLLGK